MRAKGMDIMSEELKPFGFYEMIERARHEREKPIYKSIEIERMAQNHKWGKQNHTPLHWLGILMEEVGEVAKDVIEYKDLNCLIEVQKELIQVAAVAVAFIDSLNRNELKYKS
jgi:NTP pyrophosphatase (non-canonical NTP hydrolase)